MHILTQQQIITQQQLVQLQSRLADPEARLNQHSQNASQPASSDPPTAPPRPVRRTSGRKAGGQPGHPRHHRPDPPPIISTMCGIIIRLVVQPAATPWGMCGRMPVLCGPGMYGSSRSSDRS
ncbi:MAG: DUF6444 domain-containing protein [Chloroflexales bacterium]|nr:DUF6444 domain-containing protein [Chloroflexales bacterium]